MWLQGTEVKNKVKLMTIVVLMIVLFLLSMAVIDAKSSGRSGGKSSGSHIKSVSSKTTSSLAGSAAKIIGVSTIGAAAKNNKKKIHLDDDILENETEDVEQSPGMGFMSAIMAIGIILSLRRKRTQAATAA
jgi:hypothetical protein